MVYLSGKYGTATVTLHKMMCDCCYPEVSVGKLVGTHVTDCIKAPTQRQKIDVRLVVGVFIILLHFLLFNECEQSKLKRGFMFYTFFPTTGIKALRKFRLKSCFVDILKNPHNFVK